MSRVIPVLLTAPILAFTLASMAAAQPQIKVERQITGPDFDNAYPYSPRYESTVDKLRTYYQASQPVKKQATLQDKQANKDNAKPQKEQSPKANQGEQKKAEGSGSLVQQPDPRTRSSFQFGTNRVVPQYQPGNAQNEFNKGQQYNQERYKKMPGGLKNHPSWKDGHFLTEPNKKIKPKPTSQ